jgi:hypothetical protein
MPEPPPVDGGTATGDVSEAEQKRRLSEAAGQLDDDEPVPPVLATYVAERVVRDYLAWWKRKAGTNLILNEGKVHVALKCTYVTPALETGLVSRNQVAKALGAAAVARSGGGVHPAMRAFRVALTAACGGQDPAEQARRMAPTDQRVAEVDALREFARQRDAAAAARTGQQALEG